MKKTIAMLLMPLLFLSSCSILQKTENFTPEQSVQIGEALLPQDVLFLVKFSTEDEKERNNYQELKEVLVPIKEEFKNELIGEIEAKLTEYEINFENDIKPLFGEKTETIFAIGGELTADSPDVFIVQKLDNLEKYTELTNKLLNQQITFEIENGYKTKEIDESGEILFFGEKNGFLILTNNETKFTQIMNLNVTESLVYHEKYTQIRGNLPATFLGLFYLNIELFALEIKNALLQAQVDLEANNLAIFDSPWIEIVSSMGVSINAEDDGIKFLGYGKGNETVMEELDFKFNKVPNQELHLDKSLPGKGLYLYTEAFNLKQKFEDFEKSLQETDPESYELYQEQKEQAKLMLGFDIDEDILTWLDKSVAISAQNIESVIPGITLAIDVSSNPEGAGKLLNTIDSFISIAMLSLQEYATAIERQNVEIGDNTFEQFSVLPENLPLELQEQGDLIVPILSDLKISYGITKDNILIFSTYPNLAEDFQNDVISENVTYKQLSEKIDEKGQGVFYFSPNIFSGYLGKIKTTMEDFSSLSSSEQEDLGAVIDYLRSLEGLIFTSVTHDESYESQGYLKVNR